MESPDSGNHETVAGEAAHWSTAEAYLIRCGLSSHRNVCDPARKLFKFVPRQTVAAVRSSSERDLGVCGVSKIVEITAIRAGFRSELIVKP